LVDGYVWQKYLGDGLRFDPSYHEVARADIVSFISEPPGTVLDVGCAGGTTGGLIKAKYPGTRVVGIELNADAAAHARQYLDKVVSKDFDALDRQEDLGGEEIGTVLLLDVLEHLIDPWRALLKLKEFITSRTRVLASIPNVRNLATLHELGGGRWQYQRAGVLDITHLRFFTLKEMRDLFEQTGYDIVAADPLTDPDAMQSIVTSHRSGRIDTSRISVKYDSIEELEELYAIQFVVDARKRD
jgi:2-polyprenyl-3-methyl-5-hydroxy-6-metoxy-1,4-benzoquinol methylase